MLDVTQFCGNIMGSDRKIKMSKDKLKKETVKRRMEDMWREKKALEEDHLRQMEEILKEMQKLIDRCPHETPLSNSDPYDSETWCPDCGAVRIKGFPHMWRA